mgnify:CR=1 FL=1
MKDLNELGRDSGRPVPRGGGVICLSSFVTIGTALVVTFVFGDVEVRGGLTCAPVSDKANWRSCSCWLSWSDCVSHSVETNLLPCWYKARVRRLVVTIGHSDKRSFMAYEIESLECGERGQRGRRCGDHVRDALRRSWLYLPAYRERDRVNPNII